MRLLVRMTPVVRQRRKRGCSYDSREIPLRSGLFKTLALGRDAVVTNIGAHNSDEGLRPIQNRLSR